MPKVAGVKKLDFSSKTMLYNQSRRQYMNPRKSLLYIVIGFISFYQMNIEAQNVKAKKGSFGVDKINKIIVWHQSNIDSVSLANINIKRFRFKNNYKLVDTVNSLSYAEKYAVTRKGTSYALYITKLPLVQIDVDTILNKDSKVLGRYRYYNGNRFIESGMGIEYRGNLSLTYPKKTFDLEFWSDSIRNKSRDVQFKNLRDDDDWILDGLYNEPLRFRSYIAANLWTAIHKPYYQGEDSGAKSGFDVAFVEVFQNRKYQGVFALSESVDRKLLNLKKNKDQIIKGELFKASSYEGAPGFKKAPKYDNLFPHWGGFEMIYPVLDYQSHWEDLAQLITLVVNGTEEAFTENIAGKIDLENTIDYFLFINLLRATDNLGKNYYLARYDKEDPYFFIPWDLDGVMGIIQDGKRIATTNDILSNGLFDRLLQTNPNGFKGKLKLRWNELRKNEFDESELQSSMEELYSKFQTEKIYEREHLIWPNERSIEDDYAYLLTWLKNRLIYLDTYFQSL